MYSTLFNSLFNKAESQMLTSHIVSGGKLRVNPLMDILKPQSNGPLYSSTTAPPSPLVLVPNVTAHPSTASVATSYYSL